VEYYLLTTAIFFCIFVIENWGLNLQFGITGILNFTYITFVAIGAYFAGVTALAPANGATTGVYILGWHLPYPIPAIFGGLAAAILAVLIGIVGLRRLRSDYLAIATVSIGQIVWFTVGNYTKVFNGWDGITSVPHPWNSAFQLNNQQYMWVMLLISAIFLGLGYLVINALYKSPYGRVLRAIREDEDVVAALGKNVFQYKMSAFVIGSVFAGIAGSLTVEFIQAFNPSGWTTPETFIIWAAMLVGGRGNNRGMVLGAILVPVLFNEVTRFLPQILPSVPANLIQAFRGMAIGLLLILVVRFKPDGLMPERKNVFRKSLSWKRSEEGDSHAIQE